MSRRTGQPDFGPRAKIVWLGHGCNNNCLSCPFSEESFCTETSELLAQIKNREPSEEQIIFVGREPTIHQDFFELVKASRNAGYKVIEIVTNGRMFASKHFAVNSVKAGLTDFLIKIYSSKPDIHDAITRTPSSWEQTVEGIRNLVNLSKKVPPFFKPSVVGGIYVCEKNIETIEKTVEFLKSEEINEIFLINTGVELEDIQSQVNGSGVLTVGFGGPNDYDDFRKKNPVVDF